MSSKSRLEDANVIIPEHNRIRPGKKSKFSRSKQFSSINPSYVSLQQKYEPKVDSDFCERLLEDGHVQSYIDFYHLTHRSDPIYSGSPLSAKICITLEDMTYLRDCLIEAELSRREGNTAAVYSAYTKLSNFYSIKSDWKTCIFFQQKFLDVAQLTADLRAEMLSNNALGLVYQKMGDYENARIYHERHEEISIAVDVGEETTKANFELYKVYLGIARDLENNGYVEQGMEMLLKCLDASKKCLDRAAGLF